MAMLNNINNNPAIPALQGSLQSDATRKTTAGQLSFNQVLEQQRLEGATDLKFSAHAQERLQSRGIHLSTEDLVRLRQGLAQAAAKGSKESLLMKDGVGFVVSVKNQTVITAVDAASMKGNVFTNIDSAVIV
jgi:flagellar operon protein